MKFQSDVLQTGYQQPQTRLTQVERYFQVE